MKHEISRYILGTTVTSENPRSFSLEIHCGRFSNFLMTYMAFDQTNKGEEIDKRETNFPLLATIK